MKMAIEPVLPLFFCPAAVSIHDDGYMARQPAFIDLVQQC
jgi:hypothetical protein